MAVDSLWEVTLTATMFAQQFNNVFHYVRDSTAVPNAGLPATQLQTYFTNPVVQLLKTTTSIAIDYRRIYVRQVVGGFGFSELIFPENNVGAVGGDALPIFTAVEFISPRTRGDIRAGFKRFGGVAESQQNTGILTAAAVGLWQDVADALNDTLNIVEGGSTVGTLTPVIVQRIEYTTSSGRQAYRLPEDLAELEYSVCNWNVREQITSQNSRKIGRGI